MTGLRPTRVLLVGVGCGVGLQVRVVLAGDVSYAANTTLRRGGKLLYVCIDATPHRLSLAPDSESGRLVVHRPPVRVCKAGLLCTNQ